MSKRKKTHEEYVAELEALHPNIEVIGTYLGGKYKIKHRCMECGYGSNGEWQPTPANLLFGHNCPICSPTNKKIGPPPEFRNSIWASEDREFFAKYMTETQLKLYTPRSRKKVVVTCPDCGTKKAIAPMTLWSAGLGCRCSDGQSYPNKFVYALLNQLTINYITEYSPDWAENKRYDIYIPGINCIIENHGMQHYEEQFGVFGNLSETQQNDQYKQQLAKMNGVVSYISLDCRYSNTEWIKASILDSGLPELLCFSEADIDWQKCTEYTAKNMVRTVADLWNMGLAATEIRKQTFLSRTTVLRYLNKASDLGWCVYNALEADMRNRERGIFKARSASKARKVYCFELDKYFESLSAAAEFLGGSVTVSNIQQCLNGRAHNTMGYHFCDADEVDTYVFTTKRTHGVRIYCKETNTVYSSLASASKDSNVHVDTIRACCEGTHWSKKAKSSFYYLYDYTKADKNILGAISLGFVTEEAAVNQLTQISAL